MYKVNRIQGYSLSKHSRYYLDPTKSNSEVKILKKKDPKLVEKNKDIIESSKKEFNRSSFGQKTGGVTLRKNVNKAMKASSGFVS